ncbi:MAG: hypothetical protein AAF490_17950 [Chloroflexota bacterium]
MKPRINRIFYQVKPLIPRYLQLSARRTYTKIKLPRVQHVWPIFEPAGKKPTHWQGWPDNKKFAFVLTHDVETRFGLDKCIPLMKVERALGFKSLFNIVPERYGPSSGVRQELLKNGFEVGVHGLNHDGRLFKTRPIFNHRKQQINEYLREWGAVGFRAPAMHHNLEWIKELNVEYDLSTFDIDPFEPQSDGVNTIFPFMVPRNSVIDGFVEMPYTLPQDHALFIIQMQPNNDIWKRKLDWIAEKGGLALLNVHPDYVHLSNHSKQMEEFSADFYTQFLEYVSTQYAGEYWHGLPCELARYVKTQTLTAISNQTTP